MADTASVNFIGWSDTGSSSPGNGFTVRRFFAGFVLAFGFRFATDMTLSLAR